MKRILIVTSTFLIGYCNAQTSSIFKDGKGESAYKINENSLTISTQDASIAGTFIVHKRTSANTFNKYGFNIGLNTTDAVSTIKSEDGFVVSGNAHLLPGKRQDQ